MSNFAKRVESGKELPVESERFTARVGSDGKVAIYDRGRHVFAVERADWDRDGARMVEAWEQGKPYDARVPFAGKLMTTEQAKAARLDLLENGHDATLEVQPWTRYLAAAEAREGGVMENGLDAVDAEQWPHLMREVFDSLFSERPKAKETPAAGSEWISELLTTAEALPEWSELRNRVRGDQWATGIAAGGVAKSLAEKAQKLLDQLPKEDPQRLKEEADQLQELIGPKPKSAQKRAIEAAQQKAEAAAQLAASAAQQVADAEKLGVAVAMQLADAAKDAAEEIDQLVAGMGDMAGLGTGALTAVKGTPEQMRTALAQNPNLRKLVELAGRLRIRARQKQISKTKYMPEAIVDVTIGGELERLLPSELVQLVMPETKLMVMRKLLEREALQYELEGTETLDRGPVIMAVDSSGSMSGIRNQWAMAVAIAVLEIAAMQKRPFVLMHFDGAVKATFEVKKPAALNLAQLIEMVSFFSGGGTSFVPPLKAAHEIITRDARADGTFAKADVMLVTDGQASWFQGSDSWAAKVKATGASLFGVAIDMRFTDEQAKELTGCAHVGGSDLHDASANVDLLFGI